MLRRCPVCECDSIIGHGRRRKQAHDEHHDWIGIRRGLCPGCGKTFTLLPLLSPPYTHYSLLARAQALRRHFLEHCSWEEATPTLKDPDRVPDRRILRLIQKWLKAGVSEDGRWSETKLGTPQGAVASPLLANVYLHYVFDHWVEAWRKKIAKGDVVVVRYADDLVVGFQYRTEAERFWREFRERLAKSGLELPADKTRLIEFGRFAARDRKRRGEGKPETFTFLRFTHFCGQRHSNGAFIVWRITAKKRMVAKLKAIKAELQRRKHRRTTEVGAWLRQAVLGYYQYHAVPGNTPPLRIFTRRVCRLWRSVLVRRSQRSQVRWARLTLLLNRWIPRPRVLHPCPMARFAARHPW